MLEITPTGGSPNWVDVKPCAVAAANVDDALAVAIGTEDSLAGTYGDGGHAVSSSTSAHAGTYGVDAHAVALNSHLEGRYAAASTRGARGHAVALGDAVTEADAHGASSHAVAIGPRGLAVTTGDGGHAVHLGAHPDTTAPRAIATGEQAIAFAPHGHAESSSWIAIGAVVTLPHEDSVAVLLPTRPDQGVPVVVTGALYPVGYRLTLDPDGLVVIDDPYAHSELGS